MIAAKPSTPASGTPAAKPAGPAAAERFAVEFGPFASANDAEQVERQLSQAGRQTVRFRQQTGGTLYGVMIERVPTARDAQQIVSTLREQGFPEGMILGGGQPLSVRVGEPVALRGAVQLAERLRAQGHQVRVAAQSGEAVTYVIRHGNFTSRSDANARAEELIKMGLPNRVVRVR